MSLWLMIGLYIIVRCVSFMTRTGERKEALLVRILSGATAAAVTAELVASLLSPNL